jgi:hypothetical protein
MAEIPETQRILDHQPRCLPVLLRATSAWSPGGFKASVLRMRPLSKTAVLWRSISWINSVPAIFTESSVNPRSVQALMDSAAALGWEVVVPEEELLSDALGEEATSDTYLG